MTFVEASKNWTKEEQQTYFENNVKTKATCFKIVKRKVFFLKDDKWQYFYTDLGKETLKTQYNYPELFDEKRFPMQERSLKRTYIHPQYVQTYQDNYGYTTILYYHIIKPFLTYHLKTRFETVKSQEELRTLPTYYFKNDTETIEVFGSMRLYSHKHLQYQLLRIGKKTYRVGK